VNPSALSQHLLPDAAALALPTVLPCLLLFVGACAALGWAICMFASAASVCDARRVRVSTPGTWAACAAVAVWMAMPAAAGAAVNVSAATSLSAGGEQTCALVAGGAAQCWGAGYDGQLGNGEFDDGLSPVRSTPIAVEGLADAVAVSVGDNHVCAVRSGGSLACWGYDGDGALGDRGRTNRASPVPVRGITDARAVSAGQGHTCAVRAGGAVACWGFNSDGQLGDGTHTDRATPVAVRGLTGAVAVSAGGALQSCALRADRTVACWGFNRYGELGDGTRRGSSKPVAVRGLTDAFAISAGQDHSCALRAGGGVACWGYNGFGQLGNGKTTDSTKPVAVRGVADAVAIATGEGHSCAVRAGGGVVCWGYNGHGELGSATAMSRATPTAVPGVADAVTVTAGYDHTCALLAGGGVTCWGSNRLGQLGDGTRASSRAPSAGKARIAFYEQIPSSITRRTRPAVRPSGALLFADGQWFLEHLRWTGWGSKVARANGVSSSSNDIPSAGGGRRIKTPARLVVSRPGRINGHRVYRCFRMTVPPPASSLHGCLRRTGRFLFYRFQ
jgi:alpha-tubulin suppressor-like RCC1 family protein